MILVAQPDAAVWRQTDVNGVRAIESDSRQHRLPRTRKIRAVVQDFESWYRAAESRDERFDGVVYIGVRTTGVYCRPSCPANMPKRSNVSFFPTAAGAQAAGFRACRRCRPEVAPGSPDGTRAPTSWDGQCV